MKLFVLFGQRKCNYPGEFALEALTCIDENSHTDNLDYLDDELRKYELSGEFDSLKVVELAVSEKDVRALLYPEHKAIQAEVIQAM